MLTLPSILTLNQPATKCELMRLVSKRISGFAAAGTYHSYSDSAFGRRPGRDFT